MPNGSPLSVYSRPEKVWVDGALELQQGEFRRHQLEHHRAIFEFGAQPCDRGRENPSVIGCQGQYFGFFTETALAFARVKLKNHRV